MALYSRKEFWILNEEAFDEKLSEPDEYRFVYMMVSVLETILFHL
jgi:hypothetical protein